MTVRHASALALLVAVACDSPAAPPDARITELVDAAAGPHAQLLGVMLDRVAPLTVEYGSGSGDVLRVESAAALSHLVPLTRLRAGVAYTWSIIGQGRSGTFETPPLPDDLAAVDFTATGSPTTPLVMVHLFDDDGFRGYAAIDGDGEVVWHQRTLDFPFGITKRPNGTFVYMDKEAGLVEVSVFGDVLRTLPQDETREMHHDAIVTPANTILFIAFDSRDYDGTPLQGEGIWEWTPETGDVVQRWSSWTGLSPESDRGPRFGTEWLHANSLAVGARGNVLVSLHFLNQVISIAPDWSGIEMRIGGPNATHVPAPDAVFSGQHTAREVGADRILLFDNGRDHAGPSRALELAIGNDDATIAWEWQPPTPNYASAVSSARRLANGNTLVTFGMSTGLAGSTGPTEIYEVTEQGSVAWHLLVEGPSVMFRAEPLDAIAGEVRLR